MEVEYSDKSEHKATPMKTPLKKHLSSTFPPMIGRYMSDDQLTDHVSHQMSFFHKKYEPIEEPVTEEKKKSKKKVKFKKNKQGTDANTSTALSEEETEKEIERREYQEGLRDRMLEDLELLRDYYKRIYKRALNEKVTNQHKQFKHRDKEAIEKEKKLKAKEEKQKHKVVIRHPKSKLLNDQSYKQDIEETSYHKIIKLENQLKKQGYLTKISEIQAFWDYILLPGNLASILEKGNLSWDEVQRNDRKYHSTDDKGIERKWRASDIDKLIADNARVKHWRKTTHTRPRLFTPSALTDISSSQSGRQVTSVAPPRKQKSAGKSAPSTALTLEQKFPKVEFPQLAAYTLVFGEQEPDPEEILKEIEMERKAEAKRDTRSKLLTMFSHALANRAATQRLMQRNENFSFDKLVGTSTVSELLYHEKEPKVLKTVPLTTEALLIHDNETMTLIQDDERSSPSNGSSPKPSQTDSPTDYNTDKANQVMALHEYKRLPPIAAVPLTLQGLKESCQVKDAKCLSTLWVNPFLNKKSQVASSE